MGDGKYLCTFLKNKKMGAPNSPQSSEMAHREAKTEYLGAYKFFYPRFVWKPAIRPTCHAGKGD